MPFITRCVVHFDDNISFGNFTDRRCSQGVFLPLRNTCFRPVGVGRLFSSRTAVTLRKFSTVHFFAQMTNIVTSFSSCRLGFHTCGLNTVYTEVINSIRQIGLQKLAYRLVCQACYPPTSRILFPSNVFKSSYHAIDCSTKKCEYSFALHTRYDCVLKFVRQNRFFHFV